MVTIKGAVNAHISCRMRLCFFFSDIELRAHVGRKLPLPRQFYVQFSVGDAMRQTPTVDEKNKLTRWNQGLFWFVLIFPPYAGKLNFTRDGVDTSTLLLKVYQCHRFKKQDELVGTLTYTIEEISGRLNDGGTDNLCRACSTDAISN